MDSGGFMKIKMQREDSMVKKLRKRLVALVLVAGLVLGNFAGQDIMVYAADTASGAIGSIHWELDAQGTLLFRGSGKFPLLEPDCIPWLDYASKIKAVTFEINNVSDGDMTNYFVNCTNLQSVSDLPAGVRNLTQTFERCRSLRQVGKIPDSVETMERTFERCTSLNQTIKIPKNVKNIKGAFQECSALTRVPVIETTQVKDYSNLLQGTAITQPITIPYGVTDISGTFAQCKSLTSAPVLPQGITQAANCFYECEALTKAPKLPKTIENISEMFYGCRNLSELADIPPSVKSMARCYAQCIRAKGAFTIYTTINEATEYDQFSAVTGLCDSSENGEFLGAAGGGLSVDYIAGNAHLIRKYLSAGWNCGNLEFAGQWGNLKVGERKEQTVADCTANPLAAATYTGKPICPVPKIFYGSVQLTEGADYTLSYDNNINPGTAAVIITGMGNYTGSKTIFFTIRKATLTGIIAKSYQGIYDGQFHGITIEEIPGAQIRYGMKEGQYTSVECPTFKDAGVYTIYYEITKTGYEKVVGKQQVEIKKKEITDVVFPTTREAVYGKSLQEMMTSGMKDSLGTFYWKDPDRIPTVDETEALMIYEPADKKNYDYTQVQGYDSSSGNIMRNVTFTILRRKGELPELSVGFLAEGDLLEQSQIRSSEPDVGEFVWAKPEEKVTGKKSEYTLIFQPRDMRNYDWSYLNQKELDWNVFQIQQKVEVVPYPEPVEIVYGNSLGSKAFTGTNPNVKYRWLDDTVVPDKPGPQTIQILYRGESIEREIEVVVLKKKPDYVIPVLASVTYAPTQTLEQIPLPSGWKWSNPKIVPEAGRENYEAYFTPEDTEHYQTIYEQIPLMVEKSLPEPERPFVQAQLDNETICLKEIDLPAGWYWKNPDQPLGEGEHLVTVVFVPEDEKNYLQWEGKITVSVKKKAGTAPARAAKPNTIKKETAVQTVKMVKNDERTLFGAKTQSIKTGKVKFKKNQYRNKKICLSWKKVKRAKGYQVIFMKRKKGKTRMVKVTSKTKLSLPWNGIGKCYVKIRAFQMKGKKRIYGSWSACRQVKSH